MWQIVPGEPWRFDPDVVTELEIRFADEGNGRTRVDLEHRNLEGFGEQASMAREIFDAPDAWRALLDRFSAEAG